MAKAPDRQKGGSRRPERRRIPRAPIAQEIALAAQEAVTGKPADRSPGELRERSVALTNLLRDRERHERRSILPRARALHRDLGSALSVLGRLFDLQERGVRFGDGTGRVFDRKIREADRSEEPLSVDDDVTIEALLNINWRPESRGFFDCMAALSSVASEARENLERKFPRLVDSKPPEVGRRERVRYLAPHLTDREIAVLEGLGEEGAEVIRKDRSILRREDQERSGK